MLFLVKTSLHMLTGLCKAAELFLRVSRWKHKLKRRFGPHAHPKKEGAKTMKKSYLIAVIAVLAAVAGALAAVAVYLRRREKELDEYERLLFGEDEAVPAAEAAPAEEPASDEAAAPAADEAAEG